MFRFVLLLLCSTFSQFPVWVWICLFLILVFPLLLLCSVFQFRKSACLKKSTRSVSRNDDESTEEVVDSEASSSSTDEYDVFLSFRGPDTYSFGTGTGQRNGENVSGGSNLRMLIIALPVLLILLMSFKPSHEPIYSLSRSHPYEHKFTTHRGLNYYVKSKSFDQDYPPNSQERSTFEGSIEREYASILRHNCRLEIQRLHWGFVTETPHCDMFRQFQAAA